MWTPALGMLLLFQVLSGVLVAPLFSLFPVYVEKRLGLPPSFSGDIRLLFMLTGGATAFIGGAVCDRIGRKPAYLLAMTGVSVAGLMFLTRTEGVMYALAVYSGLMFGLGSVAGSSYLMESAPRQSLALATACFFMTGTMGNAAGSAASGWIADSVPGGYAVLGLSTGIGHTLLIGLAALLLPALKRPEVPEGAKALLGGYGQLFRTPSIWALLALRFLPTVYWGAVTLLMPLLLFRLTRSEEPPGYYTSVSLVLSAVCQVGMGRIVDRYGARVPVVAAVTVLAVAVTGQALFVHSVWGLVLFGLLGAGAAWSVSVSMTTLVQGLSTDETRARLLGITHVSWSGGFLGGTFRASRLVGRHGSGADAFWLSTACCILAVVCAVVVVRSTIDKGAVVH
jgi:MFS family permease